jgi:hypothetical protein
MESPVWTPIASTFSIEQHRLFNQHFVGGRGVEARFHDLEEFFLVIGDAAPGTAEREGWADDGRQSHHGERIFRCAMSFFGQAHDRVVAAVVEEIPLFVLLVAQLAFQGDAARDFETDLEHGAAEEFTVFRLVDGVG